MRPHRSPKRRNRAGLVLRNAATHVVPLALAIAFAACRSGGDEDPAAEPALDRDPPPAYTIRTVAGTGSAGYSGDGGSAVEAELDHPSAVDVDAEGRIYIADSRNHRIRMVDLDGQIMTIAGTGERGYSGDGGPAVAAQLRHPYGVSIGPDGLVYIADQASHRIRRIESDGTIRTVAGDGTQGYGGDGGPATEAQLGYPNAVDFDAAGGMYIGEGDGDRVRRVDTEGTIQTVAGSGIRRYTGAGVLAGDGGPAVEAGLHVVGDIALDSDGALYIADLQNHAVRRVDPDGTIRTIAGTGRPGYNGDGPSAATRRLSQPGGVAVLPGGDVVVADGVNRRIRLVTPSGTIHTIAGTGEDGYTGDGGPARLARVSIMDILTVDDEGRIYFSDYGNNAVRVLVPGGGTVDPTSNVEALLLAMRDAYAGIGELDFEFRTHRPGEVDRTGRVRWRHGGRLDASLSIPDYGTVELRSDGYRLTVVDPMLPDTLTVEADPETLRENLIGNLPVYSLFDWKRQLSTADEGNMTGSDLQVRHPVRWNDRDWIVLVESAGSTRYEYFVDPQSYLMWRAVRWSGDDSEPAFVSELTLVHQHTPTGS